MIGPLLLVTVTVFVTIRLRLVARSGYLTRRILPEGSRNFGTPVVILEKTARSWLPWEPGAAVRVNMASWSTGGPVFEHAWLPVCRVADQRQVIGNRRWRDAELLDDAGLIERNARTTFNWTIRVPNMH
jgi:hypothetical protein